MVVPLATAGQTRILLVEDDEGTSAVMSRLLMRMGYSVSCAGSMAAALDIVDSERVDILLSDIGLPDGSGYELMAQVRQRCGAVGVAMTGFDRPEDLEASRAAGFVNHLVKPIDFSLLQEMLAAIVRS